MYYKNHLGEIPKLEKNAKAAFFKRGTDSICYLMIENIIYTVYELHAIVELINKIFTKFVGKKFKFLTEMISMQRATKLKDVYSQSKSEQNV